MTAPDYRPRLSIEITPEQRAGLDKYLGKSGYQKAVFSIVIDDLLKVFAHPQGNDFLGALLARYVHVVDLLDMPETGDDFK